jgi:hypothetical protein
MQAGSKIFLILFFSLGRILLQRECNHQEQSEIPWWRCHRPMPTSRVRQSDSVPREMHSIHVVMHRNIINPELQVLPDCKKSSSLDRSHSQLTKRREVVNKVRLQIRGSEIVPRQRGRN